MCFKVWEELTVPQWAKQPRYGVKAGQPNPRFLDAKLFTDLFLTPYRETKFEHHTGPFLFEFQRHGMSSEEFCSRLDTFFGQLPKDLRYAVEIRNAGLLGPDYRQVLEHHGVAHVYNHWSYMPSLMDQYQRMEQPFTAPFTVLRLLTPLKMSYEAAKKRAEPYTKIVEELPEMRRETVELLKKAVGEKRKAYVLVNNRSEGNAPLTIQPLRNAWRAETLSLAGLVLTADIEAYQLDDAPHSTTKLYHRPVTDSLGSSINWLPRVESVRAPGFVMLEITSELQRLER